MSGESDQCWLVATTLNQLARSAVIEVSRALTQEAELPTITKLRRQLESSDNPIVQASIMSAIDAIERRDAQYDEGDIQDDTLPNDKSRLFVLLEELEVGLAGLFLMLNTSVGLEFGSVQVAKGVWQSIQNPIEAFENREEARRERGANMMNSASNLVRRMR